MVPIPHMENIPWIKVILLTGLAFMVPRTWSGYAEQQAAAPAEGRHKVIAYYFHTNTRCSLCTKVEQYSHEAIEQGFSSEIKSGVLEMRVVNYEQPENRHFMQEYKLVSKSLVLVNIVDGKQAKWTNLKLIWQLAGHKNAFINYVRKEVQSFLGGT
jgi:hypothetical protein